MIFGDYDKNHDLKILFDSLLKKAKEDTSQQRAYTVLNTLFEETWSVIKKYYYGTYMPNIVDELRPDIKNEAERYPVALAGNRSVYEVKDIYEWCTYDMISQVKDDIRFLEKKFAAAKREVAKIK